MKTLTGFDTQVWFLGAAPNAPHQAGDVFSAHVNPWGKQLKFLYSLEERFILNRYLLPNSCVCCTVLYLCPIQAFRQASSLGVI